jgi:hypothetical protein
VTATMPSNQAIDSQGQAEHRGDEDDDGQAGVLVPVG